MKKNLTLLFSTLLTSLLLSSCSGAPTPTSSSSSQGGSQSSTSTSQVVPPTVETLTFQSKNSGDLGDYSIKGSLEYSLNWFASKSTTEFDKNIAKLALVSLDDAFKFDGKKETTSAHMPTLDQLGFSDISFITLNADDYEQDKYDLTTFSIANKTFEYENGQYQLFVVSYQGTKTLEDNLSNFDIGINNKNYMLSENMHPEWTHKHNHKGYDIASNRSIKKVDEYVNAHKASNATPVYLFTGHSRGGAICNLVAKEFTDRNVKTFAYTYAAPTATDDENAKNYTNIFNITNTTDLVPYLPPEEVGLTLFGVRKSLSMDEHLDVWKKDITGLEYVHFDVEVMKNVLLNVFKTRAKAYEIPSDDEMEGNLLDFETQVRAIKVRQEYLDLFEDGTLAKAHTFVGEVKPLDEGGYGFYVKCAPMFIFDVVFMLIEDSTMISNIGKIISFITPYLPSLLPALPEVLDGDAMKKFLTPHLIGHYYPVIDAM